MSNLINKAKEALGGNHHSTSTSHNAGPHDSAAANKLDPRVDSDLDRRNNPHSAAGGYGGQTHGTHGTTGFTGTTAHGSTTVGPHSSNVANKLDPRVDSDLDGSNRTYTSTQGTSGLTGTTGHSSTNAGPHSSNVANKFDPRVDSGRDGRNNPHSAVGGYGGQGTHATSGLTGTTGHTSTNAGPHSSNFANKLDPRVDSDLDGTNRHGTAGGYGNQTHGISGFSESTAHGSNNVGPHSSNVANKLDPRVDSDLDGSNRHGATGGFGHTQHSPGLTLGSTGHGTTAGGYGDSGLGAGAATGTYGKQSTAVHDSKLLNKLDPRTKTDEHGRAI